MIAIFRKPWLTKVIALCTLLLLLQSILVPTVSLAVTGGPHQPEYTSYEEAGSTDMVNLLTGDFTYNIPILDVPSPEGMFSLPLSYHAGVGLDQPATWTGLGWNINAGAITRNMVEYPDDAHGESFQIERKNDDIARGWTANVPIVGQLGWDSNVGHYGTISLLGLAGASYQNGKLTGGNTMGVHFSSKNVRVDPIGIATAVMTVASLGTAAAATSFAGALAKEAAIGIAVGGVATAALGVPAPDFNSGGYWPVTQRRQRRLFHTKYWVWLDKTRYEDMYGTLYLGDMPVKYLKNDNPQDVALQVAGPSYAGSGGSVRAPVYVEPRDGNDEGAASDMHYAWNGTPYEKNQQPSSLAPDYYNVMGAGVSGAIQPYRLDVGSLAMPRAMTPQHVRVALAPFKASTFADRYKVQFQYSGSPTNRSLHQAGAKSYNNDGSLSYDPQNPLFGVGYEVDKQTPNDNRILQYNTRGDLVLPQYFDPVLVGSNTPMEDDREGLTNYQLSQGNQIQWYSNQEIIDGRADIINPLSNQERTALPGKNIYRIPVSKVEKKTNDRFYVTKKNTKHFKVGDIVTIADYRKCRSAYSNPPRYDFNSIDCPSRFAIQEVGEDFIVLNTNSWVLCGTKNEIDDNVFLLINNMPISNTTIGGLAITRSDGKKYHYALPVYEWDQLTYIQDASDEDNITRMRRIDPFASTWLLTAITGSDYVDRGKPGLDEDDWGYWTEMHYERTSADYLWRTPYEGMRKTPDDQSWSYTRGHRQQYYLKTIETRSHIATFEKSLRQDGKDARGVDYTGLPAYCGRPATYGTEAGSYQLDEIVLAKKNEYLKPGEYFLGKEILKRIKFHYDYELCPGTPNSAAPNQGKLTLQRLSIYGSNNFKVAPDYVFDYEHNSRYYPHAWDGWGMYNGNTRNVDQGNAHKVSQTGHPAPWALAKITTPLGSTLKIDYERDDYASIAGIALKENPRGANFGVAANPDFWPCYTEEIFLDSKAFKVGDQVLISNITASSDNCGTEKIQESVLARVLAKDADAIEVEITDERACNSILDKCITHTGGASGSVTVVEDNTLNRKGGRSRVAAIAIEDENGNTYRTRYLYTQDGTSQGNSSGVVAREPEYVKDKDYKFYEYLDWPSTPVMYSRVTVLRGPLDNDNNYDSKQVYQFVTPHADMVKVNTRTLQGPKHVASSFITRTVGSKGNKKEIKVYSPEHLAEYQHVVDVRTAGIGQLRSVATYDGRNKLIAQTTTEYTEQLPDQQGLYAESTLMVERLVESDEEADVLHRAMRTTKRYYPSVPVKTTTTTNGFTTVAENKEWDFITGAVLAQESQDPMGQRYRTETVPAYYIYPEMGPQPEHSDNAHMLSQTTAQYAYRLNNNGQKIGLLGAGVQTWKPDWSNYREVNSAGTYQDSDQEQHQTWRKHENYVWRGEPGALQKDGTYALSSFNADFWTSKTGWQYQGEVTRYDHYAMPLESRDLSGNHSATRMDDRNRYKIAEAAPARYLEMTYAGFEEENIYDGQRYAEGEVRISGNTTSTKAHTGRQSLSLNGNQPALQYRIAASDYDANRNYRLSVWMHALDQAQLYYRVEGPQGAQMYTGQADPTLRAGEWYLANLIVKREHLAGSTTLTVGVRGTSPQSQTYVDDFRFQPLNAGMVAYVYNDKGERTHLLNNHNLYTRYEYDHSGRMIATYQEVLRPDGTLSEYKLGERQYNYIGSFGY